MAVCYEDLRGYSLRLGLLGCEPLTQRLSVTLQKTGILKKKIMYFKNLSLDKCAKEVNIRDISPTDTKSTMLAYYIQIFTA